jgi:electron transfer flavoprotein alpha subunit
MTGTPDPGARRIWVLIEQDAGQAHHVSWELLGAARRLASELDGETVRVEAVLPGHGVRHSAEDAFRYGASRVYLLDDPVLAI